MAPLYRALAPVSLLTLSVCAAASAAGTPTDPLQFFEGVTETTGVMKVVMHKSVRTRSIGRGQMKPDGSLDLVQRVEDDGRAPYLRRWQIRKIAPGRFAGTMSEAAGPVQIQQIGGRYRFTFRMKGDMSVEQWLTPLPGGRAASSNMTVRRFGIAVASSAAIVRKIS